MNEPGPAGSFLSQAAASPWKPKPGSRYIHVLFMIRHHQEITRVFDTGFSTGVQPGFL
jgi:hypothetical protein